MDESPPPDQGAARGYPRPREPISAVHGKQPDRSSFPHLPEALAGVVTGASTRPPPPPTMRQNPLPALAPPRRPGQPISSIPPPTEPAARPMAEPRDISQELEALLVEELVDKGRSPSNPPPAQQRLSAICTYGRYEVLGRIAFGGMAEIFLGRETTSVGASRYLVIKRILPHVADDNQFVQMFLDEARLAIQLNHPTICHIYEFGELEGSYFIAMEWVNGVPLGKLIRKARLVGGIPPEIGVRLVAHVSEALHYAHRAKDALGRPMGIVHRDVSPHNVMIAYDGQVKLLDFGIAKASSHTTKTEAGVVKGKFSYMAPEQCLGKPIDARADIFALGICLYEVLTGQALYHKENEYETMRAVIHDPAPSIRLVRKDLPESLDQIVQRALLKQPEERYQTAGEMQTALEKWLADARRVVNAATVAELMEELYEEQIKRGPLVDSTPFGQSFQRMKGTGEVLPPGVSRDSIDGMAVPQAPAKKSSTATVLLLLLVLVGIVGAGGWFYFGGWPPGSAAMRPPREARSAAPIEPAAPPVPAPPPVQVEQGPQIGTLLVESSPSGATVRVGDRAIDDTTPLSVADLSAGTHHVVVSRAGYRNWEGDVEIAAGRVARIDPRLSALPRAPVAPPGRISINTRPWSKVYVGGRLLGTTPIAEATVPSGAVRLRLVDRDGSTHNRTVRVNAGGTERVFFDLNQ